MSVSPRRPPTRAEFARLKREFDELRGGIDLIRIRFQAQSRDIRTQFTRIAEMQAILDEDRIAANRRPSPRPLFPAPRS
jgi:hypothetical protein